MRWRFWTRGAGASIVADVDEPEERPRELWTVRRLAEWLGVSHQAVADKINRGRIVPHYQARTGNGWVYLFDPARVKHWRKTGS